MKMIFGAWAAKLAEELELNNLIQEDWYKRNKFFQMI